MTKIKANGIYDYMFKQLQELKAKRDEYERKNKKLSLKEQMEIDNFEQFFSSSQVYYRNNPISLYNNEDERDKNILQKITQYENLSIDELKQQLAQAELCIEALEFEKAARLKKSAFIEGLLNKYRANRVKASESRQVNKSKIFELNNIKLQQCFDEMVSGLNGRDIEPKDYVTFVEIVNLRCPSPPHIPNPKLAKDERMLSPENKEMALDDKARDGWSPSTLRNFFTQASGGVSASTKK